jgi:ubiquinone/menaquinone biosynthesis C-methylase UbiE
MEQSFLKPEEILRQLDLKEDMIAADFGSGSGGWAIPLAKFLKEGKVYAIDILEEPLSALKGKATLSNISNIELVRSDLENEKGSKIEDDSLDLVLMTNLLFETKKKKGMLIEAKRVLKNGGKILIIDWKPEASLGPKEGRVSEKELKKLAKSLDLEIGKEIEAGSYHYGLILSKY